MTHKLPIEAIKTLLIACHEAKRVVELQPPLPEIGRASCRERV